MYEYEVVSFWVVILLKNSMKFAKGSGAHH